LSATLFIDYTGLLSKVG